MIHPSSFLRRALLADAIFSGVSAVGLTLGAGAFASLLNLPEALLRETGLFLIAYTALVGWLGTRPIGAEGAGAARGRRQCRLDARQHRAAVLGRGQPEPARRDRRGGAGDRHRRVRRAAIYRPAQERRGGDGVNRDPIDLRNGRREASQACATADCRSTQRERRESSRPASAQARRPASAPGCCRNKDRPASLSVTTSRSIAHWTAPVFVCAGTVRRCRA